MRSTVLIGVFLTTIGAAACTSSGNNSSLGSLTNPSATATTENFTGTVDVGGSSTNQFTVTNSNQAVSVTLTAAGPPPTIYMGIGVGTFANGTCTLISNAVTVAPAGTAAQLSGTIGAGTYCVSVFDAGNQSGPVDYAVSVSHY